MLQGNPIRIGPPPLLSAILLGILAWLFLLAFIALLFGIITNNTYSNDALLYGLMLAPPWGFFLYLALQARNTIGLMVFHDHAKIGSIIVPWSEVESASIASHFHPKLPQKILCIKLINAERYWNTQAKHKAEFLRAKDRCTKLGLDDADFYVSLGSGKQCPETSLAIVNERITAFMRRRC